MYAHITSESISFNISTKSYLVIGILGKVLYVVFPSFVIIICPDNSVILLHLNDTIDKCVYLPTLFITIFDELIACSLNGF